MLHDVSIVYVEYLRILILTTVCNVNIYTPNTCTALDKVQVVIKSSCKKFNIAT